MTNDQARKDTNTDSRFRHLPEPIRLSETSTMHDTRAMYLGAGILPIAVAMGPDGGGGDGD